MKKQIISILLGALLPGFLMAQAVPGTFEVTWAGNTFGGLGQKWVQNRISGAAFKSDGTVYTNSLWDESHRERGIYKDGDMSTYKGGGGAKPVAINSSHVYYSFGYNVSRYNFDGSFAGPTFSFGYETFGLYANDTIIAGSNFETDNVKILRLSDQSVVASWEVDNAGSVAIDNEGNVWVVNNLYKIWQNEYWRAVEDKHPVIIKYNLAGEPQGDTIKGWEGWKPTHLNISNDGLLMVADDGVKHQIHFYDVSGTPAVLSHSFGTEGGILAGSTPTVVNDDPLKFWGITACGTDSDGNIYITYHEEGSGIKSFTPAGELNWVVRSAAFTEAADFDPRYDGKQLFSKNEVYKMDYSKSGPGSEWELYRYIFDIANRPDELRTEFEYASARIQRVDGEAIMYYIGMHKMQPHFWTNNDNNIPTINYTHDMAADWGYFVDTEGAIWEADGSTVYYTPLETMTLDRDLVYGKTIEFDVSAQFQNLRRISYFPEEDILYLCGCATQADCDEAQVWKGLGTSIARYDNWSEGNRTPTYQEDVVRENESGFQSLGVAYAGDYIFFQGIRTRAEVRVFAAADFSFVGKLEVGDEVGGNSECGWGDIPYPISAIQRQNGEYLVAIEDNAKGKFIVYRWQAEAGITEGYPDIEITSPSNRSFVEPGNTIDFSVTASDDGAITLVEYFSGENKLGESTAAPFGFTWTEATEGKHVITAVATDDEGKSITSPPVVLYYQTPDTEAPSTPQGVYVVESGIGSIEIAWKPSTDNVGVVGYKVYANDEFRIMAGANDTSAIVMDLPELTIFDLNVAAIDFAGNESGWSETVTDTTRSTQPFLGAPSPVPGLIEHEDFDIGGLGASYFDTDQGNSGGQYRPESDVDIGTTPDGYSIGWTEPTEWLMYTVDVDTAGDYNMMIMAASWSDESEISLSIGNHVVKEDVKFSTYSGDGQYDHYVINMYNEVNFPDTGIQKLLLTIHGGYLNIDKMLFYQKDEAPPTQPTKLHLIAATPDMLDIGWIASTDDVYIKEYNIYLDDELIATTTDIRYKIQHLTPDQEYAIYVEALDLEGKVSEPSEVLNASTLPDSEAPTAPASLRIIKQEGTEVTLGWSRSSDNVRVEIYLIYADDVLIDSSESTTKLVIFEVGDHSVVVKARDGSGNISDPSNSLDLIVSGLDAMTINPFRIYPNPVGNGNLTIASDNNSMKQISITVFTILGKKVFHEKLVNFNGYYSIPTNGLESGIYYLKIQSVDNTYLTKFSKQ